MRNHGGGIMEEESWRRNHGEDIIDEESWRRNHGGDIIDEESWRRNHGGGIWRRLSWELSGHWRLSWELSGHSLGLSGSWGGLGVARGGLEPEIVKKHCVLQCLSSRRAIPFESGEGPCHDVPQNTRKMKRAPITGIQISPPGPYTRPWEPLQPRAVWGIKKHLEALQN